MRIRQFAARGLLLTAGLVVAILAMPVIALAVADYVAIPGNQWLQGQGVDVYRYRQCVELPQSRLYPKFGWPTVWAAGNGGAVYIPEGSPGLIRYNPGSGYVPAPGDLIIENPYGLMFLTDRARGRRRLHRGHTIDAVSIRVRMLAAGRYVQWEFLWPGGLRFREVRDARPSERLQESRV